MLESSALASREARYELRFDELLDHRRGYAFPCDARGHVDIDELTDRARIDYFYARAVVGAQLSTPTVSVVLDHPFDPALADA